MCFEFYMGVLFCEVQDRKVFLKDDFFLFERWRFCVFLLLLSKFMVLKGTLNTVSLFTLVFVVVVVKKLKHLFSLFFSNAKILTM